MCKSVKRWTLHIPHPVSHFLVLFWRSWTSSLHFLAVVFYPTNPFLLFTFVSPTCCPLLITWWSPPVTCLPHRNKSVPRLSESFQTFDKKGNVKVFFPGWHFGIIWSPHPPHCHPSWGKPERLCPSEPLSSKFSVCCITTCSPAVFPSPQFHIYSLLFLTHICLHRNFFLWIRRGGRGVQSAFSQFQYSKMCIKNREMETQPVLRAHNSPLWLFITIGYFFFLLYSKLRLDWIDFRNTLGLHLKCLRLKNNFDWLFCHHLLWDLIIISLFSVCKLYLGENLITIQWCNILINERKSAYTYFRTRPFVYQPSFVIRLNSLSIKPFF